MTVIDYSPWHIPVGFVEAADRVLCYLHVLAMDQNEYGGSNPEIVHLNSTLQVSWSLSE